MNFIKTIRIILGYYWDLVLYYLIVHFVDCMNIIGYDDSNQYFICANSWGTSWGANGYCYIPYEFLLNPNLGFDFCVLSLEL